MRLSAVTQTILPAAFGLVFFIFGIVAFFRTGNSGEQFASRLQSIRSGGIQPETLTVVRKYVDPGRSASAHVIFSSSRQAKVNITATRDFFNSVNLGDTVSGYNLSDGYFIPQNQGRDPGAGKWFFLALGLLMGTAALAFALARIRRAAASQVKIDEFRKTPGDKREGS